MECFQRRWQKSSVYIFIVLSFFISTNPVLAEITANEEPALPTYSIKDDTELNNEEYKFQEKKTLDQSSFKATYKEKKKKKNKRSHKNLSKRFGPLELGLKVNPFNTSNSSIGVHIDILHSYEIISNTPTSFHELKEAFKPDPNSHWIDPEIIGYIRHPKKFIGAISSQ